MSEKQIREAIDQVCADLDLRARQRAMRQGVGSALLPLVLGAGLAVTACSGKKDEPQPSPDAGSNVGGAQPAYGAPMGGGGSGGCGGEAVGCAQPEYMAPDDAGAGGEGGMAQVEYMAPDAG
ncbi:MAG: hypothetical protein HY744_13865 [Deltaproteobacteria bacterium]|nr:hypothetical protein [Deltaproteobacteria bacterium]